MKNLAKNNSVREALILSGSIQPTESKNNMNRFVKDKSQTSLQRAIEARRNELKKK